MATRTATTMHDTVDRLAAPVMLALLAFALLTVGAGALQSRQTDRAFRARDRHDAWVASHAVSGWLGRQNSTQATVVASSVDVLQPGAANVAALKSRIAADYFLPSQPAVVGVVVTSPDGEPLVQAWRTRALATAVAGGHAIGDLSAIGRSASGSGAPRQSGLLTIDGPGTDGRYVAQAVPLTGVSKDYGSWVVVRDLRQTTIAPWFGSGRRGALVDDRGRVLVGSRPGSGTPSVRDDVTATAWHVEVPRLKPVRHLAGWVYALLLAAVALLGAIAWMQELTRRALREEAAEQAAQARALYDLAASVLHAPSSVEQGLALAEAVRAATGASCVRARLARDLEGHDLAVGGDARRASDRCYRVAIVGGGGAIGELAVFTHDVPLDDAGRSATRTMTALAGAAIYMRSVAERERGAAEQLQRVDELRTNLLSTVAHELRSPLTAVKGILGLMQMRDGLDPKVREYVDIAMERTDSLVELIRDLFDCSLLESGQLDIKPERVRATDLVQSALGALATSRPGEVRIDATPNLLVTVDPLRFDQIVNNLVTNAFRHGAPPIDVELRPGTGGARLTVTDHGPGIPADERERIFGKFHQVDSGNARLVEGAGLGLALVSGLVHLHGGRIEVDSARLDGSGARFTVTLPDVVPSAAPGSAADARAAAAGGALVVDELATPELVVPEG